MPDKALKAFFPWEPLGAGLPVGSLHKAALYVKAGESQPSLKLWRVESALRAKTLRVLGCKDYDREGRF